MGRNQSSVAKVVQVLVNYEQKTVRDEHYAIFLNNHFVNPTSFNFHFQIVLFLMVSIVNGEISQTPSKKKRSFGYGAFEAGGFHDGHSFDNNYISDPFTSHDGYYVPHAHQPHQHLHSHTLVTKKYGIPIPQPYPVPYPVKVGLRWEEMNRLKHVLVKWIS